MSFELGLNKKTDLVLIVLVLLLAGFSVWFYTGKLKQVQDDINRVQAEIVQEEQSIETLSGEIKEREQALAQNTLFLQEKVPVAPLVDQFLLNLGRIQKETDTFILNIHISHQDADGLRPAPLEPQDTDGAAEGHIDGEGHTDGDDGQPDAVPQVDSGENPGLESPELELEPGYSQPPLDVPENVKQVTYSLTVAAPDFGRLEQFVSQVENLPRITKVEALSFAGLDELSAASAEETSLTFRLDVATFYVAEMDNLVADLPQAEFLAPSGKENPLFGGVLRSSDREDTAPAADKDSSAADQDHAAVGGADQAGDSSRFVQEINDLTYYVLQAGAFDTLKRAQRAAEHFQVKGWPVFIQQEILPYRVYIGMTASFRDALALAEYYQARGVEVYLRPFNIPPLADRHVAEGEAEMWHRFVMAGDELIRIYSQAAVHGGLAVSGENVPDVQDKQHSFAAAARALSEKLDPHLAELTGAMTAATEQGLKHLDDYEKTGKREHLVRLHEAVMRYLIAYEKLISALTSGSK
ncbi:Sporulation domain-containing protein [Caldalkalibacillus thermarum TA2.A1]|uniref:SPOR domain-containing protein n=1 Tax=Caldalkalibacillus thermarum (strain TA2.A1) TaxID=986075 RepID=F5LAM4_CALTT|nr:SPOR domain-containing protein [Caldalkalibacillus thermarum]EGL81596.1 Sporulation domain-containing protein [Caldalkalibacillus thermarum TA2.A1]QZT33515.1 SPOR domain-containing protein [Caldalkalibacillus thermarum TA2.A1]